MPFASLGLSTPLCKSVAEQGCQSASRIQIEAIPAIIAGNDVMGAAQTGTGKTAGFTLPILERLAKGEHARANQARCLILTPTRELAAQVASSVATYGKYLTLKSTVVFGGVKINPQMMKLRNGVDILVATPGRLLDLYSQNAVRFQQLEILLLDEADRMLDMGFIHDIRKIIKLLPRQRQNLMFSATFSAEVRRLAKGIVHNPVEISVSPQNTTAETVDQWICPVDKSSKAKLLTHLILNNQWTKVLVFSRTKHGANRLTRHLESRGIKAAAIHGNKSQGARTKTLADFRNNLIDVLVATDIAARGLDIDQLPKVVNFDLPHVSQDYIHRIGRTGRAGVSGQAISLVCADEAKELFAIERLIGQLITRKQVEGFEPVHELPESRLDTRPYRPKKPKKPKRPKVDHKGGQRSGESNPQQKTELKGSRSATTRKPAGNRQNNSNYRGGKKQTRP